MKNEVSGDLGQRVRVHAALADATRLQIVDRLAVGDVTASELGEALAMPSNLLAHHLKVLTEAGLVQRRRSEGDRRRSYLRLVPGELDRIGPDRVSSPDRVVFVCTANSARSQLAAALWRRSSRVPASSAGTHPGERIAAGALAVAARRRLPLPRRRPAHLDDVVDAGDLIITVCDRAHEELGSTAAVHWSVPDPVRDDTDAAFDVAYDELAARITGYRSLLETTRSSDHDQK